MCWCFFVLCFYLVFGFWLLFSFSLVLVVEDVLLEKSNLFTEITDITVSIRFDLTFLYLFLVSFEEPLGCKCILGLSRRCRQCRIVLLNGNRHIFLCTRIRRISL